MQLTKDAELRDALSRARTIAVLGAHEDTGRAAFYVPDYLRDQGYRIIPVNPFLAGREMWGERVRTSLRDLADEPIDLVDVFRRGRDLPGHLPELLGLKARPLIVWFQLGIRNDEVAAELEAAGITVVQDRCTLADHRRLGVPPLGAPTPPP